MTLAPIRSILILLLLCAALACGELGGPGNPLDVALIRDGIAARSASPFPTEAGVFLNYAGGAPATFGLTLVGSIVLILRAQRRVFSWFLGICLGGRLLIEAIKLGVHRARPALDPHPVITHSLSFPSAHAANSMIVFPAIVLFFVTGAHRRLAMIGAVAASVIVGASRPLLGVHWPSDVIAGWAIGAAWLTLGWSLTERSATAELHHDVIGGHGAALLED